MAGRTVGVVAMRGFETASLHEECRSGQLWWTPDRCLLPRMIRWIGFSRFSVEASVSCMLQAMYERADPIGYNGYHYVAKVLANAEIGDAPQDVYLLAVSRRRALERMDEEVVEINL